MMPERWQQELQKLENLEPPVGLWDRVMRGPRREPPQPHRRRQAIAPIAAGLAVAVVLGTLALVRAFGPASVQPGSPAHRQAGRLTDPSFGWSIRYPAGMEVAHFRCTEGLITCDGVRVTNFLPDIQARSTYTPPMSWLRSFPANGVAVQIEFSERLPAPPPLRDSAFPLSPSSFRQTRPYVGGKEPHPWSRGFWGDGFPFTATVWVGHDASRAERHAAWAVVRSLRFPALREGTIWRAPAWLTGVRYYVLGRASRYPVGSVTTFPPASLPGSRSFPGGFRSAIKGFYLIHAPRAFYVITKVFQTQPPPSFKVFTCTVAFDPKRFQFYCPGTGLRWNRAGQPIGAHAGSRDWAMGLHIATVAQDGHVLFSPEFGPLLPVVLKGSPWG
jgi:hypothetical protein